jgi:RNA polymerase sigma-70 factor (ECF subfamily)
MASPPRFYLLPMPTESAPFPPTRWTLIQKVRSDNEAERLKALEELWRAYWFPLYALARRLDLSSHEAEDAVQGFVASVHQTSIFTAADPAQGRLRSLLLVAFRRFLTNHQTYLQAAKRRPVTPHLDLEEAELRYQAEFASQDAPPDVVFHRKWAENLIQRSLRRLELKYEALGQGDRFRVLRSHLPWDGVEQASPRGGESLGLSQEAFRTALHRLRAQFRAEVIEEVRQTLGCDDPVVLQAEIRDLFQSLAS